MLTSAARTRRHTRRTGFGLPRAGPIAAMAAASLALGALAGCAHRAPSPAVPPPAPATAQGVTRQQQPARPAAGYTALRDTLASADSTGLRGRRVVIDPGHGGFFKGCVGVGGLTEAEVNLAVALQLDSLLVCRGADVLLTRNRDRDFLVPADSSLKHDLAERVRIANAFRPDLFVSVHHNADPGGAHDVNETQTYYQLGDEGPSYDAGTDVHRSLVRNLGIAAQKLAPGNFAVVRGSEAPALLTEASYLTDPDVEAKLRTPEARRLEAEALLLGIEHYFARRAPVIELFEAARPGPQRAEWSLQGGFPMLTARIRGAFDEVVLRVDGTRCSPLVAGDSLWWTPPRALPAGPHLATLAARFAGEGSSRAVRLPFTLVKAFDRIAADFPGQPMWVVGDPIALRVCALDADGLPLTSEGLAVRVRARFALPKDTVLVLRDGAAWGYFRGTPGAGPRTRLMPPEFVIAREPVMTDESGAHQPADAHAGLGRLDPTLPAASWRTGFAHVMPSDAPLRDAPGTAGTAPGLQWLNRDGFVALRKDSADAIRVPHLPGYRAWDADSTWPPRFVAIAGGALHGRRIVLDPEGGGDDAGGTGPSGTRAAALNLDVARALAGMLTSAGAEVLLTREGDAAVSEVERVQLGEGFRAERYLRIGHAAAPPVAGHYFSSGPGRRWAQHVAAACAQLGVVDSLPVSDMAKYAITQSSATALYASLTRIDAVSSEARLLAPGAARREAYALFLALASDFAPEAHWPIDSLVVRDGALAPISGAIVTLGGTLVLQADANGCVRFARTEPGPVELVFDDPRAARRSILLD